MEKSDKLKNTIYTIGHSNLDSDEFTSLLKKNSIDVIADVRSQPYSKFHPQFNKEFLEKSLLQKGIQYVFMGKEFGARRDETSCYVNGKVSYQRVWELPLFKKGIDRIKKGVNKYNIALMCAEYDPKMCHRTILVGRFIEKIGITVEHILKNGDVINHKKPRTRIGNSIKAS